MRPTGYRQISGRLVAAEACCETVIGRRASFVSAVVRLRQDAVFNLVDQSAVHADESVGTRLERTTLDTQEQHLVVALGTMRYLMKPKLQRHQLGHRILTAPR
jgi:hypothetical protein